MPKTVKMELARTGVFGEEGTVVTAEDLKEVAETFSGQVPITFGHTLADFMPAVGYVKSVRFDPATETLIGEEVDLSDALVEAMDQKMYKNWSIGVRRRKSDGKKYLHHLAFLGAVPPKIKDLKILEDVPVVYMADDIDTEQSWTDNIPESFEEIQSIKEAKVMSEERKEESKDLELAEANQRLKYLETALRNAKKEALRKAIEGKVPAAKLDLVMELADHLPIEEEIELSDDMGKRKVSAFDILKEIFASIPLPVKPGEMDMGDVSEVDSEKVDAAAMIKSM